MAERIPSEFTDLRHKLLEASDVLSTYCTMHGESELSHFFQHDNQQSGLRQYIDEEVAAIDPNFMCHKDAATGRVSRCCLHQLVPPRSPVLLNVR